MNWPAEVTVERVLLALSLAGNFVLAPLLFFKSALNEIVAHWYKERTRRREKNREILRELNQRMVAFQRDYFLLLLSHTIQQNAPDESTRAVAARTFKEMGQCLKTTTEFLDRHELDFPQPIRDAIRELRKAMEVPVEALSVGPSLDEIMSQSRAVTAAAERIRAEVGRRMS